MRFTKIAIAVTATIFLFTSLTYSQDVSIPNTTPTVESQILALKQAIPTGMGRAMPETTKPIYELATTKRLDVAVLLVKAMAFNFDPYKSLESRSQEGMIPAIEALKRNFSPDVLALLFVEGITTDKEWMRERCALAARYIGSDEELARMKVAFALGDSKYANARKFLTLLNAKTLKVEMFNPGDPQLDFKHIPPKPAKPAAKPKSAPKR